MNDLFSQVTLSYAEAVTYATPSPSFSKPVRTPFIGVQRRSCSGTKWLAVLTTSKTGSRNE